MLLTILISLFFEIKANFPSTCRMNRDCSIYGPEYVCDIYLRICQNPWDLSKQCLEDYDCPRGYACEQFCKYGLTPRESTSNSTWTPWKPWPPQPYPFCHRRRSNALKYILNQDGSQGIIKYCLFSGFARKWTLLEESEILNMVKGQIDLPKVLINHHPKVPVTMMMIVLQHLTK